MNSDLLKTLKPTLDEVFSHLHENPEKVGVK